jgi:putative FmdB family regulatory protein
MVEYLMPIYEFKCQGCGSQYEADVSIHAEVSAPNCVPCGQVMGRVWSTPGVTFNAGGFYSTDNRPRPKD